MNTTLSAPSRHDHPPQQQPDSPRPVRRVGLLDRLALRLGLALLVWARRPSRARKLAATERYVTEAELRALREVRFAHHHLTTMNR